MTDNVRLGEKSAEVQGERPGRFLSRLEGRLQLQAVGPFRQLKRGDWITFKYDFLDVQEEVQCTDWDARMALYLALGDEAAEAVKDIKIAQARTLKRLMQKYERVFDMLEHAKDDNMRAFLDHQHAICANCRAMGHFLADCNNTRWTGWGMTPQGRSDDELDEHQLLIQDVRQAQQARTDAERRMLDATENHDALMESLGTHVYVDMRAKTAIRDYRLSPPDVEMSL